MVLFGGKKKGRMRNFCCHGDGVVSGGVVVLLLVVVLW